MIGLTEREHLGMSMAYMWCSGFIGSMTKTAFPEADKQTLRPLLTFHLSTQFPTEPQGLTELGARFALGMCIRVIDCVLSWEVTVVVICARGLITYSQPTQSWNAPRACSESHFLVTSAGMPERGPRQPWKKSAQLQQITGTRTPSDKLLAHVYHL